MVKKYAFDGVRFAKDLHSERWGRGEGVREVARNIGCSPSTVSRWERALNEPPIVIFLVACGVYGLNPLDYLMEENGDQPALPGFEALANVPLVPMSQQELSGFFEENGMHGVSASDGDAIDTYLEGDWYESNGRTPLY